MGVGCILSSLRSESGCSGYVFVFTSCERTPVTSNLLWLMFFFSLEDKRPQSIILHWKKALRTGRNSSKGPRVAVQTLGDNISNEETAASVLLWSLGMYSVNSLSPPCQRFSPFHLYESAAKTMCFYTEWLSSDVAWSMQVGFSI